MGYAKPVSLLVVGSTAIGFSAAELDETDDAHASAIGAQHHDGCTMCWVVDYSMHLAEAFRRLKGFAGWLAAWTARVCNGLPAAGARPAWTSSEFA